MRQCPLCPCITEVYSKFGRCPVHGLFRLPLATIKVLKINGQWIPVSTNLEAESRFIEESMRDHELGVSDR
jgi:hypothetical protein